METVHTGRVWKFGADFPQPAVVQPADRVTCGLRGILTGRVLDR